MTPKRQRNTNNSSSTSPSGKDMPLAIVDQEVSIKEIYDVIEFAKQSLSGGYFPGIVTPDLINSQLKNKNYNPQSTNEDKINAALADPKNNEQQLREMVEYLELASSPFKRVLAYMNSHLAFDYTYTSNAEEIEEYTSKQYKKDELAFCNFMDRFDYKQQFGNVVKQLLRNETMIACPRFDGEKIVLQELPLNYTKITALWDLGFLVSLRMDYFLQPGVMLNMYPAWFTQEFNKIYGTDNNGKYVAYNPAIALDNRGNSTFATWVDVPPEYAWVFKFDTSIATMVPYYASLMPEFINAPFIRALQKNQYMAAASKMILGSVPMIKDAKTKVADSIMISATSLGQFLALLKSAIGEAVKVAAAPLEGMTPVSFQSDNTMYSSYLKNGVDSSGINAPLVFSSSLKANAIESQLSFQSDSLIMEKLYSQFDNFVNYFSAKETKKYKFTVEFEGNNYFLDRKSRFDYAIGMANLGMVLPQKIAASRGIAPHRFIKQLQQSKAIKFTDLLTPIILNSQMPADGGRPQKSSGDLTDSGSATRDSASNVEKGGSV